MCKRFDNIWFVLDVLIEFGIFLGGVYDFVLMMCYARNKRCFVYREIKVNMYFVKCIGDCIVGIILVLE